MGNLINNRRDSDLSEEALGSLLNWLDPDREQAGIRYEEIRRRLIQIFMARGCPEAEDLADITIGRVANHVRTNREPSDDPVRYFHGVAKNVHLEYLRRSIQAESTPASELLEATDIELRSSCLERCLENLPAGNRELILQYYLEEKRAKIDAREHLASELGIPLNALRIRAHRIRTFLSQCIAECMKQQGADWP